MILTSLLPFLFCVPKAHRACGGLLGEAHTSCAASASPIMGCLCGSALEPCSDHSCPSDLLQHLYFSSLKPQVMPKVTLQLTPESKTRNKGYTVSQRDDPSALGLWEALV